MTFGADKRAQSTLVGFILLFGILVIAFSSYQAFVVPNQNAEVEFNHNQQVQTDMQELRNSLLDVRSVERINEGEYEVISEHRPARVRLGTQYPARLIALNPPAPTGTLTTEEPETNVRLENAEPENPENFVVSEEELGDLFDDFENDGFETRFLGYSPGYNEYRNAPETVFEHSLLYNEFRDGDEQLEVRDQRLVTNRSGGGSRLNVILFDGDISRASAQSITIDPETVDGPTAPIRITGEERDEGRDDITLTLPTNAPDLWEDRLDGRQGVKEVNHEAVEGGVEVTLNGTETHQLRLTRVVVDGGTEENEFTPIQLADVVVGEQDESRFTTLIAETNAVGGGGNSISEVEFEWVASNNPDSVTFEVENTQEDQTSSETFTGAAAGSGDVTIDGFGSPNRNNVEITATVQKGGLTETCSIVDLDSGQTYNKADGDFDCNT